MANNIYSDEHKKITEKLRDARIEAGYTQEQVADKLGKPQSYVSKSEAGERRLDITELKKFAELYKKSIEYFME
ncbi:MAG TPA: helix-turn-helix transcriptional regulator [Patescibacteria group bacterium]|nr:helix-turn-helix transcriptional regulator [Patescibacteria group bacterium]